MRKSLCTIRIENIRSEAVIGVEEWERAKPTSLLTSLTLTYNSGAAEHSDDIADAVDYAALSQTVTDQIRSSSFRLLETLAGRIAHSILLEFPSVKTVSVSLCKPGILREAGNIWVTISRRRRFFSYNNPQSKKFLSKLCSQ